MNDNIEYYTNIDLHWKNIHKWWNKIKIKDNLFPSNFKLVSSDEKFDFNIHLLFIIKKIFDIDDIRDVDKIILKNYDLQKLYKNFSTHKNLFLVFLEKNTELKNIFNYIMNFHEYFSKIKKKFISIIKPIIEDKYFNKLFKIDDDLTRVLAPIAGTIFYLYLTYKNIYKVLDNFLILDETYIQFFIVSYLIIDEYMDSKNVDENEKKIFLKWFMKIVENPSDEILLNEKECEIWQCITFRKYFLEFHKKYPSEKYKIIYDYVKFMIYTLKKSNKNQKKKDIDEYSILEETFKKSYVVSFFMALLINIQLNIELSSINKKNMYNLCKLLFLVQLYDDFFDIDKDCVEENYTYFYNETIKIDFTKRVMKLVRSSFILIRDLELNNNNDGAKIKNIIHYIMKNVILLVFYIHKNKLKTNLIDYFSQYSFFSKESISLFDKNTYNQYENNILLKIMNIYYREYFLP
jgi:hypothetical protein